MKIVRKEHDMLSPLDSFGYWKTLTSFVKISWEPLLNRLLSISVQALSTLFEGLRHLHKNKILHHDIKPSE